MALFCFEGHLCVSGSAHKLLHLTHFEYIVSTGASLNYRPGPPQIVASQRLAGGIVVSPGGGTPLDFRLRQFHKKSAAAICLAFPRDSRAAKILDLHA